MPIAQFFSPLGMDHIIAIISDAASVMELLAKILDIEQQLCLAHGNHLGVVDVVYKGKKASEEFADEEVDEEIEDSDDEEESNSTDSDDSDEDNENGPEVEFIEGEEELELNDAIKDLIDRVRMAVNKINKSPVKSWELQQTVKKWQKANGKKIEELVSLIIVLAPTNH